MLKRMKLLKNQKGLTLIELLVVVVILGIIAAIAVPSIGGLIDNSKKDAHVANAQQMVNAARLVVTGDTSLSQRTHFITLGYLEANQYLDTVMDPDDNATSYVRGPGTEAATQNVIVSQVGETAPTAPDGSYVRVVNGVVEAVKLVNGTRGVQGTDGAAVVVGSLTRDSVTP